MMNGRRYCDGRPDKPRGFEVPDTLDLQYAVSVRQAQAVAEISGKLAGALIRGVRGTVSVAGHFLLAVAQASVFMRVYRELDDLDEAGLALVGIARDDIARYALAVSEGRAHCFRPESNPAALRVVSRGMTPQPIETWGPEAESRRRAA